MGFLDKIKAAKNLVTGGGAKVSLQVGQTSFGQPIPVMVSAQVAGAPVEVAKVYIVVRAVETVNLVVRDQDNRNDRDRVHETAEMFRQEFPLTGPMSLPANSQHEWQGQVTLPPTALPTYLGKHARHVWSFQAGLDMRGNDPDSGWIDVQIR